jgi:hypothetical protein
MPGLVREGASTLTGGTGAVSPADVTGLVATHEGFSEPDADGKRNAIVHFRYSVPVGWTGEGVHIFVEAPDGSGSNPRARLGAFTLGTSALAPEFTPYDAGKFPYDATNDDPVIIELDAPATTEPWRIYAVSYTGEIENALKPATETGAPPSTVVNVTPPGAYISGEEWAYNVTGFTASVEYSVSEAGDDIWRLVTAWTNPDDPRLAGIEIVIRPVGTSGVNDSVPSGLLAAGTSAWQSDWWPIGADLHFTAYCVSVGRTGSGSGTARNTIIAGVTPRVEGLSAVSQRGPTGQEYAPFVTAQSASVVYSVSEAGDDVYGFEGAWTLPVVREKFRGVKAVARFAGDPLDRTLGIEAEDATTFKTDLWAAPTAAVNVTIYFVSIDANNRTNTITASTPKINLTIQPQVGAVGIERAPLVTGQSATVVYAWSEAGDSLYGFEGSWVAPVPKGKYRGVTPVARFTGDPVDRVLGVEAEGALTFKTDLWPAPTSGPVPVTIYFVSIDANNRANTITGSTPKVDLTITAQVGGSGVERAPLVTGFGVVVEDAGVDETGGQRYRIVSAWVLPSDVTKYRGLKLILRPSGGTGTTDIVVGEVTATATNHRSEPYPMPDTAETYTLYAVSLDANNRANSIVPGSTPSQIINLVKGGGTLKLNRADASSFNSAEFSTVGGSTFQAVEFSAGKIFVGSILRVGGGFGGSAPSFKGSNGQIAVYNASNALRAWMGQNGSVFGGWFGELYIGGTSPTDAPLYSSSTGVVFIGGNRTGTPYVTIRNNADVEVARIGANIDVGFHGGWFKQIRIGGVNISNPVIQSDAAGNVTIDGATFALNRNNHVTSINNTLDGSYGEYMGLTVTDTLNSRVAKVSPTGFRLESSGVSHVNLVNAGGITGSLLVTNSTNNQISIDSGNPRIIITYAGSSAGQIRLQNPGGTPSLSFDGLQILTNRQAAVADASGGATVDTQARTAINTLLARLRTHGLIAP